MIELIIPGRGELQLEHLVTDVNGTLAVDGVLIGGLTKRIAALRDRVEIHMLTADTHGRQAAIDEQLNSKANHVQPGNEAAQKAEFVRALGAEKVVAIGQGANDAEMLKAAALGICVMSPEGDRCDGIDEGLPPLFPDHGQMGGVPVDHVKYRACGAGGWEVVVYVQEADEVGH